MRGACSDVRSDARHLLKTQERVMKDERNREEKGCVS
jgi:hypothetical protein